MWCDGELGVRTTRDWNRDGGRQSSFRTATIDDLPHGPDVDSVVLENLDECFFELSGPDRVEQLEQPSRRVADVATAVCDDS